MKNGALNFSRGLILLGAFAYPALATDGKGAFDGLGAHPGFTVTPISSMGNVATMGLGWLSNGDMVWVRSSENYGGGSVPGASAQAGVWLVKNITGTPQISALSTNWRQPTGVAVGPNDEIMVPDRDAIYRVSTAGVKTKVIDNPVPNAWHQWIFTPMYYDGRYYAPYSGTIVLGGPSNANPSSSYSGAFLSWTSSGGSFSKFAGGFRSCNGSGIGSGAQAGFMLVADNQGSWEPSCPIHIIRQNRFYGHKQNSGYTANWAQEANANGTMPYDPPVAWMLDSDASGGIPFGAGQSTSQPLYMERGLYAGDWIVGDINQQGLARLSLDPVNGSGVNANFNGSVTFFTGGFADAAINRLAFHPTQNIVFVGTSSGAGCNWPCSGLKPFYKITFDDAAAANTFEILSVKSRRSGIEIEFTQPVNVATAVAASFGLRTYNIVRQSGYGAGNNAGTNPTVGSVQVSQDKKRMFLGIGNQAAVDRLLVITAAGIRSEAGNSPLFFNKAWFTHNYQSQADFNPVSIRKRIDKYLETRITHFIRPGALDVRVDLKGPYTVSLRSVKGRNIESRSGSQPASFTFTPGMGKGVFVLQVTQGERNYFRPVNF